MEPEGVAQRKTLWIVLAINAAMFVVEIVAGLLASSTGLIADSLDMLADASVYPISLYAVGRAAKIRTRAATISGALQITLGVGVMIANSICLKLIAKHKGGDVNFRESYIFSANDVAANIGVIVSGFLVLLLGSRTPDLIVGIVISAVVVRGGFKILADIRNGE
jgi:Co/Zn/Cd efflux system component